VKVIITTALGDSQNIIGSFKAVKHILPSQLKEKS